MPRYYFDLSSREGFTRDRVGQALDESDMKTMVARVIVEIASDEMPLGDDESISITVRDESDRPIYTASLTFRSSAL